MLTSSQSIEVFFQAYPKKTYQRDELIMSSESSCDFLYFVESGAVKMTKTSSQGQTLVLHVFFPASFFSLLSLLNTTPQAYDFITLTQTTVFRAPKAEVMTFLKDNNLAMLQLQERLLQGLAGLLQRLESVALAPAYNQVASLLLYFAKHFSSASEPNNQVSQLLIKITHQEISQWLGLSRENVSIHMKHLERDGLIQSESHLIKIIDREKLHQLATTAVIL